MPYVLPFYIDRGSFVRSFRRFVSGLESAGGSRCCSYLCDQLSDHARLYTSLYLLLIYGICAPGRSFYAYVHIPNIYLSPQDESEDSPQPEYNWTGIIISALVITVILSLVVISTVMLTPSGEGHNATDITLAMFLSGELNPRLFNGTWVSSEQASYCLYARTD
jgi:hypothetical protein